MTVLIGCGALVSEVRAVLAQLEAERAVVEAEVEVHYLPANLHNRPERIVDAINATLEQRVADGKPPADDADIVLGYADCGTGGGLDRWLADHPGAKRLPGAHCYAFLAGAERFERWHDREPGTFYLTDFLAKNFEPLVWQGLGLDAHPELLATYFGNYRRVVLISQSDDDSVRAAGAAAALRLGLAFEHHHVGREPLRESLLELVAR